MPRSPRRRWQKRWRAIAGLPRTTPRAAGVTTGKFGLRAVSVVSSSNAWAVGEGPTVLHWNGTTWAKRTIPGLAGAFLSAVDALSPSNVWAAGFLAGAAGS